jgi:hypothetical protein
MGIIPKKISIRRSVKPLFRRWKNCWPNGTLRGRKPIAT